MIVVDTNVLAYFYLPGKHTAAAEAVFLKDPEWVAPRLWRSEFRNVLATYMRGRVLTFDEAVRTYRRAESLIADGEYDVGAVEVLRLASESGCSGYDCEFVALAEHLDVRLVSADARLCRAFPKRTLNLARA